MKTLKIYTFAITTAFVLTGGAVYAGFIYLDGILNPKTAIAATPTPVTTPTVLPNKYTLNNFKFDFRRINSINGQKVIYNGKPTLLKYLTQADRAQALQSAISNEREASVALDALHDRLSENVGVYQLGQFKTEGVWHSIEAVNQLWDGISEILEFQPDIYLRIANVIGDDKVSQDLYDAVTLLDIAKAKRDVQGLIYAHRKVHDLNSYVFGNVEDNDPKYGAARAMNDVKASQLAEIAAYIKKNTDGTA